MSEHTTHINEPRLLQRSRSDRMVAGVAGGLARYFEIHPAVFRVGFVVLTLLGGAGILIYAVAALAMPDEGKRDSIATAALRDRRDRPWPLIGLGLLSVAVVILISRSTLWFDGGAWWLFLIAGGLILWLTRQSATTAPDADAKELAAADSRRLRRALRRVTIVLASILALIVVAVAIFMAVFDVHPGRGIGDRTYAVSSVQELNRDYRLGIGSLELDLSDVRFPAGETRVDTSVDVGDLEVIVPAGVAVRAHGKAQAGHVNVLGSVDDGRNADVDVSQAGNRVLVLDADVGAGAVRVHRAVR